MAKTRYTGRGALVKANVNNDGNTMVTIGLCTTITPPGASSTPIDCTGLEDTYPVILHGIEEASECTFECLHDPEDTGDDGVETLYGNKLAVTWQIIATTVNSSGTTKTWTKAFSAKVMGYKPGVVDGSNPIKRTITLHRTSAVTDTVA